MGRRSFPGRDYVFGFPKLRPAGDLVAINLGSPKGNQRLNVPALLAERIDDGPSGRSGLCRTTDDLEGNYCVDGLEASDYTDESKGNDDKSDSKGNDDKSDSKGNDCTDDLDNLKENDGTNVLAPDDTLPYLLGVLIPSGSWKLCTISSV
jgi:hypothetical protein